MHIREETKWVQTTVSSMQKSMKIYKTKGECALAGF